MLKNLDAFNLKEKGVLEMNSRGIGSRKLSLGSGILGFRIYVWLLLKQNEK